VYQKRAGTGEEKGKGYQAKQSDNESVLQVSFFVCLFSFNTPSRDLLIACNVAWKMRRRQMKSLFLYGTAYGELAYEERFLDSRH
jgi:hypothetical protein